MMEAENYNWCKLFNDGWLFENFAHEIINPVSIFKCLAQSRPGNEPALGPAMHFTGGIIVRVEQIGVLRVYRCVVRQGLFENKGLEKPARVRKMPFRRARLRHRLDDTILGLKRLTELFAELPDVTVPGRVILRIFSFQSRRDGRFGSSGCCWRRRHQEI